MVPIAVFALLESGCREVWLCANNSLAGIEPGDPDESVRRWREFRTIIRTFRYGGTAGDRNQHMMSAWNDGLPSLRRGLLLGNQQFDPCWALRLTRPVVRPI